MQKCSIFDSVTSIIFLNHCVLVIFFEGAELLFIGFVSLCTFPSNPNPERNTVMFEQKHSSNIKHLQ